MKGVKGFQKGHPSYISDETRNKMRLMIGGKSQSWKGDNVSYIGGHARIRRMRGKASFCAMADCKKSSKRFDWANLTGNYGDIYDYVSMCKSCHIVFDRGWRLERGKKLKAKDVLKIRQLAGTKLNTEIGEQFKVTGALVGMILSRKIWNNI